MSIEDFVWDGQAEENVLETAAPSRPPGWFQRLRGSVWLEPALKIFGLALLLGVLAGIGVVASSYTSAGRVLPSEPAALAAALGSSWLKPSGSAQVSAGIGSGAAGASAPAAAAAATATATTATDGAVTLAAAGGASGGETPAPSPGGSSGITADGRIILNVASAEELTKLPGIGAKRAQAIIALRAKLGRFKRPSDLLRVKGIGPRSLQRMLPHLVLDAP